MPNPYDDIFNEGQPAPEPPPQPDPEPDVPSAQARFSILDDDRFTQTGPEPLDEILQNITTFNERAMVFSRLLSELRVVDHRVTSQLSRVFFAVEDPHARGTLAGERQYHALQEQKFRAIIVPMRDLAELHLLTVRQFNRDVDEHYYSAEKTERTVASETAAAIDGINLQRKILADAADSLNILTQGLVATERRIRDYVNAGGVNNISQAEYELIIRQREQLSSGREHNMDYDFFSINVLDKTAISLGIYLKETSTQYLNKLDKAIR
ncbi:hypothetical protein QWY85_15395 [Neolewinella lacunae]|uniref:Uncharacterized protein n=1 Tax=Neolewinella lacunae TaxID=1517758 RepID=A0A923TCT3_9BACT|nr:hypothetical protein [Neolewinella lacunae]MBC6994077.1 hypothetical protein [Neolewinella lacunae]MDN3636052.1 hypothetical protein [Neolewinella lacunae]